MLIKRRNRLVFPAGVAPGVNYSHPASSLLAAAYVNAGSSPTSMDLQTGILGVPHQPNASMPGLVMDGTLGPTTTNPNASYVDITRAVPACNSGYLTMAGIFRPNLKGYPYSDHRIIGSTSSPAWAIDVAGGNPAQYRTMWGYAGSSVFTGMPFIDLAPQFFAISATYNGVDKWIYDAVLKRLDTGAIFTESVTTASSGNFRMPIAATSYRTAYQNIDYIALCRNAAGMGSFTRLSMAQLLDWADDPWSFWYPAANDNRRLYVVGATLGASESAAQTIPPFSQVATAKVIASASATQTVPVFGKSETVASVASASASQIIPAFGKSETVSVVAKASSAQNMPAFTANASAVSIAAASANQIIPAIGEDEQISHAGVSDGYSNQTVGDFRQVAEATVRVVAGANQSVPAFGHSATLDAIVSAIASSQIAPFSQDGSLVGVASVGASQSVAAFTPESMVLAVAAASSQQSLLEFLQSAKLFIGITDTRLIRRLVGRAATAKFTGVGGNAIKETGSP